MKLYILQDVVGRFYTRPDRPDRPKLFNSRAAAVKAARNTGYDPVEVSVTYVQGKVVHVTDNIEVTDGRPYIKTPEGLVVLRDPRTWIRPGGIFILEEVLS